VQVTSSSEETRLDLKTTLDGILDAKPTTNGTVVQLSDVHYESNISALTVTITVGCALTMLNVIIFVAICHQRAKVRIVEQKNKPAAEKAFCQV